MKTNPEQLAALEKRLAGVDGAEMIPLPVELLRSLMEDARAQEKYSRRVDEAFDNATMLTGEEYA